MIKKGVLPAGFRRININLTSPLYRHQQNAIEKVLRGKNLVVSTGTGSGKTESFLIPVLSQIISEHERGILAPGVRALLIYPMNALANDQIERLRALLGDYPEITYGSYTGQTETSYEKALAGYKALNGGATPAANELISREQMQMTPPHILITNYAMLEYLMVRPRDSVFFDTANGWRFIVLDEAHIYSGSTGIEVSMLLRRLKSTLKRPGIQYILTSATLGDDNSNKEVAEFAAALCAAPFSAEDVVRADRVNIMPETAKKKLPVEFYKECGEALAKETLDTDTIEDILKRFGAQCGSALSTEEKLYNAIIDDETFLKIKRYVGQPKRVSEISSYMGWSTADAERFVMVASKAEKNGVRLFDARYHMFLRATEGVFVTLGRDKKLFLDRKEYHIDDNGESRKVFEIGTCSFCHSAFITGEIKNDILMQSSKASKDDGASVFLLGNKLSDTDEDHLMEDENIRAIPYEICPTCGFTRRADTVKKKKCGHAESEMVQAWKLNKTTRSLNKCPSCESVNPFGIIRMFFTGQEAVTSVIGTALFESLPSYAVTVQKAAEEDDSGFEWEDEERTVKIKEAKQFLAFSDSRQAAAFYASYMDKTYRSILYKRMIVEALKKQTKPISVERFADELAGEFEKYDICETIELNAKEAWKAILAELVDNNGNTSLYKMGLLGIGLEHSDMPKNDRWKLSSEEVRTVANEFLLSMMADAAISHDKVSLTKADLEDITHGGIKSTYSYSDTDAKRRRKAFIPTRAGLSNKRVDYIEKIAAKVGQDPGKDNCIRLLKGIWEKILTLPQKGILTHEDGAYRVNINTLTLSGNVQWYRCPKCKKITANNVKNICPTYRCDGELEPVNICELFADNHYFEMYRNMDMRPLRIVEHSAQLSKDKAYEYQKQFQNKEIDVLSCSTTFEMGVDVGSLETVFMRNMPPSPANYAQRAGRAGRGISAAAFALTFCNKNNHDFSFFKTPAKMIKGKIYPPSFNTNNEKIAIRHVYASALSFFWKEYSESFKDARTLIGDGESAGQAGIENLICYLEGHPKDLAEFVKDFLPDELAKVLGADSFGWLEGLIGKEGLLMRARDEYLEDVRALIEERKRLNAELKGDGFVVQRLRTYYQEPIIAFLSRKGVFPRYGFPVDTVEMTVPSDSMRGDMFGIQLQRDLAMAISEYAPGSQVVANGMLLTSRYIKRSPNMLWKMYDYKICSHCNSISLSVHISDQDKRENEACACCGEMLVGARKTFIIPEFGFIADSNLGKPGLIKPKRTYNNEIAYAGKEVGDFTEVFVGRATVLMKQSRKDEMVVINDSGFYVCESCGYAETSVDTFSAFKKQEHKKASGYPCGNKALKRYSLGYRFETDVLQLRFSSAFLPALRWDYAYSVLHGLLRGLASCYGIDERDIAGCLQYYDDGLGGSYSIVLYDTAAGGAGYVRKIKDGQALEEVLMQTRQIMLSCSCGGENGDTSCYSCLRNYYNQKHHDDLKRGYVIDFIDRLLG